MNDGRADRAFRAGGDLGQDGVVLGVEGEVIGWCWGRQASGRRMEGRQRGRRMATTCL